MEKRKIIWIAEGEYELLKPRPNKNGWHDYGKRKSMKAISDLLTKGGFELYMDETIVFEVSMYRKKQAKESRKYFSKNKLEKRVESKTI